MNFREQSLHNEIAILKKLNAELVETMIDIRCDYYREIEESDFKLFIDEFICNLKYPRFKIWDENDNCQNSLPSNATYGDMSSVIDYTKKLYLDINELGYMTRIFVKGMYINPHGLIVVSLFIERPY